MSSIYTKNGDTGETGLLGEGRTSKANIRIEVLGTVDEVSANLGVARSFIQSEEIKDVVLHIQKDLYNLMAEIGATPENASLFRKINASSVDWLEEQIQKVISITDTPKEFIIPGEIQSSALMSVARTVVRRAERRLVELNAIEPLENHFLLAYLNRLSSLCFALELLENHLAGKKTRAIKNL